MDCKEAYEILHPDTTRKKLAEIEYYGGFEGQRKTVEAVNEACIVACEAMKELQLYKENKLCLIPDEVYKKQCEELDEYKALGTLEEVRTTVEKQKAKKPEYVDKSEIRYTDSYRCPNCGRNFSGTGIADHCYHCGQKLDWSVEE